ncbi:MAG: hypothetical protein QW783_03310 [Candidatus Micrarchaeia archaeon]
MDDNNFTVKGFWWLPDNSNDSVSGILEFKQDEGSFLELIGSFRTIDNFRLIAPEIILGETTDGEPITLYKNFTNRYKLSLPFSDITFKTHYIFRGKHFNRSNDIRFSEIFVYFKYLKEWVAYTGFEKIEHDYQTKEILIRYKLKEPQSFRINDEMEISIEFVAIPSALGLIQKEYAIKEENFIRIKFAQERNLDDCLDKIWKIQNFITLAVSKNVHPKAIELKKDANRYPIKLFYFDKLYLGQQNKEISPFDMTLPYPYIKEKLDVYLRNWFIKYREFQTSFDIYFSTLYNSNLYLETQFLNLLTAFGGYYYNKTKIKKLEDVLYKTVEEFDFIRGFIDKEEIKKIIITRNYYAHADESKRTKILRGSELLYFKEVLNICFIIILLQELGLTKDEILEKLEKKIKFLESLKNQIKKNGYKPV